MNCLIMEDLRVMCGNPVPDSEIQLMDRDEEIRSNWYESWISAYLLRDGSILREKEGAVPCVCVRAVKLNGQKGAYMMTVDEQFFEKSDRQMEELQEEWRTAPERYQSSGGDTAEILRWAKYYELVFGLTHSPVTLVGRWISVR